MYLDGFLTDRPTDRRPPPRVLPSRSPSPPPPPPAQAAAAPNPPPIPPPTSATTLQDVRAILGRNSPIAVGGSFVRRGS